LAFVPPSQTESDDNAAPLLVKLMEAEAANASAVAARWPAFVTLSTAVPWPASMAAASAVELDVAVAAATPFIETAAATDSARDVAAVSMAPVLRIVSAPSARTPSSLLLMPSVPTR